MTLTICMGNSADVFHSQCHSTYWRAGVAQTVISMGREWRHASPRKRFRLHLNGVSGPFRRLGGALLSQSLAMEEENGITMV